ncbi:MAG: nucleoside phosphorylase [Lishizhenia sp.]
MHIYPETELILNADKSIYHLGLKPGNLAKKIILVGDQDRVSLVSSYFDKVTFKHQNREFVTHTGEYNGKPISCISTGIGTDNIDIVLNEIDAVFNVDFESRTDKKEKTALEFVRIGTCGILGEHIPVDSFILSSHALGFDNLGHFYKKTQSNEVKALEKQLIEHLSLPKNIIPYLTKASTTLNKRLKNDSIFEGITITSTGFYGPQGRRLRIPVSIDEMNERIYTFKNKEHYISNFEMECSAVLFLAKSLGHEATTICLGMANRRKKIFSKNYDVRIRELVTYVLERV